MKRFPSSIAVGLVVTVLFLTGLMRPVFAESPQAAAREAGTAKRTAARNTVQLIVDYGDGVEKHFPRIKWQDKMTVQGVTLAASKHPRGIQIKQRGKKATAFLSQIDNLANQSSGLSWVYRVNGKLADRSFGVYPVKAGDVVLWAFQEYP